jgi:hypothetical protein
MKLVRVGNARKNRGPATGEKRGREHQQPAQQIQQPLLPGVDNQNEAGGHNRAYKIACNHHALAVEPVERNARDGSSNDGRQGSSDHHAANGRAGSGDVKRQAKDRNTVEVVPDFADNLP